jgi:hypothetical protein
MHGQNHDDRALAILHDSLTFVGSHYLSQGNDTPVYDDVEISKDRFRNGQLLAASDNFAIMQKPVRDRMLDAYFQPA